MDKDFKKIFDKLHGVQTTTEKVFNCMEKYQEYLDMLVENGFLTERDARMKFFVENQEVIGLVKEGNNDSAEDESDDSDDEPAKFAEESYERCCPETTEEKAHRKAMEELSKCLRENGFGDFHFSYMGRFDRRKPRG